MALQIKSAPEHSWPGMLQEEPRCCSHMVLQVPTSAVGLQLPPGCQRDFTVEELECRKEELRGEPAVQLAYRVWCWRVPLKVVWAVRVGGEQTELGHGAIG